MTNIFLYKMDNRVETSREMAKITPHTRIIFGLGHYNCAAAAAIIRNHFLGAGDDVSVYALSRGELARELTAYTDESKLARLLLVGIGLMENPQELGKAMAKLKRKGTEMIWVSTLPKGENVCEPARKQIQRFIVDENISITELALREFSSLTAKGFGVPAMRRVVEISDEIMRAGSLSMATVLSGLRKGVKEFAQCYQMMVNFKNEFKEDLVEDCLDVIALGKWDSKMEEDFRAKLDFYNSYGHRVLKGASPPMRELKRKIKLVAKKDDTNVLLVGETGTGKETVALMVHAHSVRITKMPQIVSCATADAKILEITLRGSIPNNIGAFALANRGTLILDEIGDMPLKVQGALVRVLAEKRFSMVGSNEEQKVDVRVICTTSRNLWQMVQEGRFREDLFYCISEVVLRVPSLREIKDDIPYIANAHWYKIAGGPLPESCRSVLQAYKWPGNVRQLSNVLKSMHIFAPEHIKPEDWAEHCQDIIDTQKEWIMTKEERDSMPPAPPAMVVRESLDETIKSYVCQVYEQNDKNLTATAKVLGKNRSTVRGYLT